MTSNTSPSYAVGAEAEASCDLLANLKRAQCASMPQIEDFIFSYLFAISPLHCQSLRMAEWRKGARLHSLNSAGPTLGVAVAVNATMGTDGTAARSAPKRW